MSPFTNTSGSISMSLRNIAIFDHPDKEDFSVAWRVGGELGVGPSRQILGDWRLDEGERTIIRYRLLVYTGDRDPAELTQKWTQYAAGE